MMFGKLKKTMKLIAAVCNITTKKKKEREKRKKILLFTYKFIVCKFPLTLMFDILHVIANNHFVTTFTFKGNFL